LTVLLCTARRSPVFISVRAQSDDSDGLTIFFLFDMISGIASVLSAGLPEIPDRLAHPPSDFGQFASPENDQNNNQDNNHFLHSDAKHMVSFIFFEF
jgi:hypothetical protein